MDIQDRELLELAAKASGIEISTWSNAQAGGFQSQSSAAGKFWNPLTDDGDALRLAVTLSICIDPYTKFQMSPKYPGLLANITDAHIRSQDDDSCFSERHAPDAFAATRRAIVRAAAEIGKQMP